MVVLPMDANFMFVAATALVGIATCILVFWARRFRRVANLRINPIAVNYHFTRECNYSCGFCFHTAKNSFKLPLEEAKRGLSALVAAGVRKINFAGGEPFLFPLLLGDMVQHCKEAGFESVSIITNGSRVKPAWMNRYGRYVDVLGVSCDSAVESVNRDIGRWASGPTAATQTDNVRRVATLCREHNIMFKLNSVVCAMNQDEDMSAFVLEVAPVRWKVFQVLPLDGENQGAAAIRNVSRFLISNGAFAAFVERHRHVACLVPESNTAMQASYLMLDERMRFLDSSTGGKIPTKSILEVGVERALAELRTSAGGGFNSSAFVDRGGVYDWRRTDEHHGGDIGDMEDLVAPARER